MSYRFLIVDVSATVRAVAKRTIKQSSLGSDCQVYEAATGAEAMEQLAHHPVDLVLVDPRLPDMDGLELIGRIMSEPDTRGIPVVVLAARPDPRKMEMLRRRGVKGHLRKPFSTESFHSVVGHILEPTHV